MKCGLLFYSVAEAFPNCCGKNISGQGLIYPVGRCVTISWLHEHLRSNNLSLQHGRVDYEQLSWVKAKEFSADKQEAWTVQG